ncbi:MAG: ribonuclease P protein component, partial [Actinomycetota bacterium]|nr:ribonuclease P protein component [Actinomycetota bacterium]
VAPHLPGLAPGSRLVVRALPPARAASYDELAADLDAALARAGRPVPGRRRSP